MRLFCSVLVCFLLGEVSARRIDTLERIVRSVRVERDTYVCKGDEGLDKFQACTEKAETDLFAALKEDDGRPDKVERKLCNAVTYMLIRNVQNTSITVTLRRMS